MISKKLRTFAASLALCLISVIPASAANIDISHLRSTKNVRLNKPYIQYDIVSSYIKDLNGVSLTIRDKNGKEVANSYMTYDSTEKTLKPRIKTALEDHVVDFSNVKNEADIRSQLYNHSSAIDPYFLENYTGKDPKDKLYFVNTNGLYSMLRNPDNSYDLNLDHDYYRTMSDYAEFEAVDTVTVPANQVFVDVDSKYVDLNDRRSRFHIEAENENMRNDYATFFYPLKFYENAGKRIFFNADPGKYRVFASGGSGGYMEVYDHDTTYKKIRIKFHDAFPNFCNESLSWDHDFFGTTYHIDLRGDRTDACCTVLYHSGAAVSTSIPDKDGYIYIWMKDDDPNVTYCSNYCFKNGGGTHGGMYVPTVVDKIHVAFDYPTKRYCIYNLAPGEYTVEIANDGLRNDYTVKNNKFTVKNTRKIQSFDFKIVSKNLMLGDVNGDGSITVTDISKAAAYIKGVKSLTEDEKKRADTNRDGVITVTDISKIAAHVKGLKALS